MRTLGEKIRSRREELALSQTALAKEAKVDVTSLNKLEKGKLETPSSEFVQKIAKRLGVTIEELLSKEDEINGLKIGVGSTLWAAPLFYLMAGEDRIPDGINLTYFTNADGEAQDQMVFHNKIEAGSDKKTRNLLSAQELRSLLNSFDLDAIFIPAVALRGENANITKICSITSTIEGGLDVLLFFPDAKKTPSPVIAYQKALAEENYTIARSKAYEIIDYLLKLEEQGSFIFKKDTVAEAGFSRMILSNSNWKSKSGKAMFKQIALKRDENIDSDFFDKRLSTEPDRLSDAYCAIFTWEPLTSGIEQLLTARGYTSVRLPAHIFSVEEKPTFFITFDLVARNERVAVLKKDAPFNKFLRLLQDGIKGLEEDRNQQVMHYSLEQIAKMLKLDTEKGYLKIHKRLHEINFQMQFYPEWVFL